MLYLLEVLSNRLISLDVYDAHVKFGMDQGT